MKKRLRELLVCPQCAGSLEAHSFEKNDVASITDGLLICGNCKKDYYIVNGIPRMVSQKIFPFTEFYRQYQTEIDALTHHRRLGGSETNPQLKKLQSDTADSFGFEWKLFNRFGWDHDVFNIQHEEERFYRNTLFDLKDLKGKLMLDGGCGNGRYMMQCVRQGAEVVGIDFSRAIDVAQKNLCDCESAHFVQADLFGLPFRPQSFDLAYSIGVLMHTGNAAKAFQSLSRHVKDHGLIGISVYQKQNLLHEFNDRWIRALTTRLPHRVLLNASTVAAHIASALHKVRLLGVVNAFMRLEPFDLCVFDWYSAPTATHHTYPEVKAWFENIGAVDIKNDLVMDTRNALQKFIWPRCGFTVRGTKHPSPSPV